MSPEQARGKSLDKRTDIWSFGCVLFECLTGRRAFDGESLSDVIAAVLQAEPDFSRLPASTPAGVRELVRRCLVKDARRRLRDAGDARIALEETADVGAATAAPRSRMHPLLLVVVAIAAIALGFWIGARGGGASGSPPGVLPAFFRQVSDLPGAERQPSLSPDGKSVLYVHKSTLGNADIFLQRVEGRTPINLTSDSPVDDSAPAFSPNGELIAFRSDRNGGGIFVMGATGESVRRVTDFGYDPAWSPDGSELAVTTEPVLDPLNREYASELWIVSADGGEKQRLTVGDAVGASWSPDGRRIAYWGWREPDWQRDVFTIAADGSEATGVLVTDDPPVDWSPAWTPDGRGLYFGSNRGGTMNLWRVALDPTSGRPTSRPVPITTAAAWTGGFSVSADGRRLAYATRDEQTDVLTVAFDPEAGMPVGSPRHIFGGRGINDLCWSPGGDRLVLSQRGEPWESLAIIRADGTGYARITDASIQHRGLAWRPVEGSELILFYSNANLMTIRSDGSGARMVEAEVRSFGGKWSADGRHVLSNLVDERWKVESFVKYEVLPDDTFRRLTWDAPPVSDLWLNGLTAWTSIGARALAMGTAQERGLFEIDMKSGSTRKLLPISGTLSAAAFLPDGRRFLFKAGNRILRVDPETLKSELVFEVEQDRRDGMEGGMSLSRDGRKLAVLARRDEGDIWVMEFEGGRID